MKKIIVSKWFVLLFILFCSTSLKSQFSWQDTCIIKNVIKIPNYKTIVLLEEPREAILKKIKKNNSTAKEAYLKYIEEYNSLMKEVVEKYWKYSKNGIEYLTFEQMKNKCYTDRNYICLYCESQSTTEYYSMWENNGLNWSWDMSENTTDKDYLKNTTTISAGFYDYMWHPLISVSLPEITPKKEYMILGLKNIAYNAELAISEYSVLGKKYELFSPVRVNDVFIKNATKLKKYNLLICNDMIGPEYDTSKISDNYKYNYSICSVEAYLDAIKTDKQNTAILIVNQINRSGSFRTTNSYSYNAATIRNSEVESEFRIYDVITGELLGVIDSKAGNKVKKSIYKYTGTMTITNQLFTELDKQIFHIENNYMK